MAIDRAKIDAVLGGLIEKLAAIEHERWSHWQRYMHSKGVEQEDGSLIIPAELVGRWELQAATPFNDLSESERNSDREQVAGYLHYIAEALELDL